MAIQIPHSPVISFPCTRVSAAAVPDTQHELNQPKVKLVKASELKSRGKGVFVDFWLDGFGGIMIASFSPGVTTTFYAHMK